MPELIIAAMMAAIIFGMPATLLVWFQNGTCNWGRHDYGNWGEPIQTIASNWPNTMRQYRTCKICGKTNYRDT